MTKNILDLMVYAVEIDNEVIKLAEKGNIPAKLDLITHNQKVLYNAIAILGQRFDANLDAVHCNLEDILIKIPNKKVVTKKIKKGGRTNRIDKILHLK